MLIDGSGSFLVCGLKLYCVVQEKHIYKIREFLMKKCSPAAPAKCSMVVLENMLQNRKPCRTRHLHRLPTIQNHFCVKEISGGQAGVAM